MTGCFASAQEREGQIDLPPITFLTVLVMMFNSFFLFTATAHFLAGLLLVPLLFVLWKWHRSLTGIRPESWLLMAFLSWFLLSFAFRDQPYGYQELVAYSGGPIAYLVLTRSPFFRDFSERKRILLIWLLALAGFLLAVIGLATFPFEHVTRLSSLFKGDQPFTTYPNALAMVLLMGIPFQAFLVFKGKRKTQAAASVMLALTVSALFLTFSRGAYLALLGSILVTAGIAFWFSSHRKALAQGAALLVILAGMGIVVGWGWNEVHRSLQPADLAARVPLTQDVFGRIADTEASADQSTDERWQFWNGSLELIRRHPWFGVGSDGFRFQYPAVQTELLALSTHPHNLFLKIAVENGLPAALLLFSFLALLFLAFLRLSWRDRVSGSLPFDLVLIASFLAANVHLLTDYNLNAVAVWVPYWGLLTLMGMRLQARSANRLSRTANVFLSIGGAIILVIVGASFVQYRLVKHAQALSNAADASALFSILTSSVPRPFQSLAYEEAGRAALAGTLTKQQGKVLATVLAAKLSEYPSWPELRMASARLLAAQGNNPAAINAYQQALRGNAFNNLDWHLEYLRSASASGSEALASQSDPYHALLTDYLAKLRMNAHMTVLSENPRAGADIIRLFMDSSGPVEKRRWTALNNAYLKAWRTEREKFQALFPGTVLPE